MKNRFDEHIINIQKNAEEKRLIFGQKFERFLLKKLRLFGDFLLRLFSAKSAAFSGCLLVVASSVLIRSQMNIGPDSAVFLEVSKKMLNGGKYVQDFWENSSPLFFIFGMLPHLLVRVFSFIHPAIAAEIVLNLIGILTVFCSAKIATKSDLAKDQLKFNLIIISFACAFFLRPFTLQYNEFGTKSSYFLALVFPYISLHFIAVEKLTKRLQALIGALAGLLCCLDVRYSILVLAFEMHKIFLAKRTFFYWRNAITLALIFAYSLLIFYCFPDYAESVITLFAAYYAAAEEKFSFVILRYDVFPVIIAAILFFSLLYQERKSAILSALSVALIGFATIAVTEIITGFDQRFLFYAIALPFLVTFLLTAFRQHFFNVKRDWLRLLLIMLLMQFDVRIFFLICDLCCFWWVIVLVMRGHLLRKLDAKMINQNGGFIARMLVPNDVESWAFFILFAATTILLSSSNYLKLTWIFSAIIFAFLLHLYQQLHEKAVQKKEFSRLSAFMIFFALSRIVSLYFEPIIGSNQTVADQIKSPNYVSEKMYNFVKNDLEEDENFLILAKSENIAQPLITYLGSDNAIPFSHTLPLYYPQKQLKEVKEYFLQHVIKQMKNEKNEIIFVEGNLLQEGGVCDVSVIELSLRNPDFRAAFKNYIFVNRIVQKESSENKIRFFFDGISADSALNKNKEIVLHDIEIYRRK
jgi:hypothetical protein